jgi:hypothetical protein
MHFLELRDRCDWSEQGGQEADQVGLTGHCRARVL